MTRRLAKRQAKRRKSNYIRSLATRPSGLETIGDFFKHLCPGIAGGDVPEWPPDAFALAAALLKKSGAYTSVLRRWSRPGWEKSWQSSIHNFGIEWRRAWMSGNKPPNAVRNSWRTIIRNLGMPLVRIPESSKVHVALLRVLAAADEASMGLGIPSSDSLPGVSSKNLDVFQSHGDQLLLPRRSGSSLCHCIDDSNIRVLPKMHTPQTGLTIRSFSNNLGLCSSGEIQPEWYTFAVNTQEKCLNLLVVPWPDTILPSSFAASREPVTKTDFDPGHFGLFTLRESREINISRYTLELMREAKKQVGRIDGVVFPELAVPTPQHRHLASSVLARSAFLICGAGRAATDGQPGQNHVCFDLPIVGEKLMVNLKQKKHHRWRLDKPQIIQYGLGTNLHPESIWWEDIDLAHRKLIFVAMRPWLIMTVLICEDLARPDPAADLVRAVGPNLVVALLMDGPQLGTRWSSRYATILADDPGSSVLCLTSQGMSNLSRPRFVASRSSVVALWKDAKTGVPVEIELPNAARAVVLNITVDYREEWTADGRSDYGATAYPTLAGIHYV